MRSEIDSAAKVLASARSEGEIVTGLEPRMRPRDEKEAYLIQDRVHEFLEEQGRGRVIGHKIGCTTPVMQKFLKHFFFLLALLPFLRRLLLLRHFLLLL